MCATRARVVEAPLYGLDGLPHYGAREEHLQTCEERQWIRGLQAGPARVRAARAREIRRDAHRRDAASLVWQARR
eukprot:13246250-Heterocapsa_arctica.AAC.1